MNLKHAAGHALAGLAHLAWHHPLASLTTAGVTGVAVLIGRYRSSLAEEADGAGAAFTIPAGLIAGGLIAAITAATLTALAWVNQGTTKATPAPTPTITQKTIVEHVTTHSGHLLSGWVLALVIICCAALLVRLVLGLNRRV
jgi:hypothetical protein